MHTTHIHKAVLISFCALLFDTAIANAGPATNDYIFVHTTNGLLSRYRVQANGTLADLGDLMLPVPANDTVAFPDRGLLYVALVLVAMSTLSFSGYLVLKDIPL